MIPKVFHAVKPQDFTMRPIKVNRAYSLSMSELYLTGTGSGYYYHDAYFSKEKMKLGTDSVITYPTNSFDGSYCSLIWNSIDRRYYRYPYDPVNTLEHSNARYTLKNLNESASIISIPYMKMGESIQPKSVIMTGSYYMDGILRTCYLRDDGYGNLYDENIVTDNFPPSENLILYARLNDYTRYGQSTYKSAYLSNTNSDGYYIVDNATIDRANIFQYQINEFDTKPPILFDLSSSLIIKHTDSLDLHNQDFTVSFYSYVQSYGDLDTGNILTKESNYTGSNQQSISKIDQFPFKFYAAYDTQTYNVSRSDGINTIELIGESLSLSSICHHALVKSGSLITLYQNGVEFDSVTDKCRFNTDNVYNLIFGYNGIDNTHGFVGNVREFRLYNKALTVDEIQTLNTYNDISYLQTNVVGNVFYRTGNIVLTNSDSRYNRFVDWYLSYNGTHTIYEYECLIRVKKSMANLTLNSTARKSNKLDLLSDDFTGSFNGHNLTPYITTIGLYNETGDLVVIAKPNQPIKTRPDVDINFLIRFHG